MANMSKRSSPTQPLSITLRQRVAWSSHTLGKRAGPQVGRGSASLLECMPNTELTPKIKCKLTKRKGGFTSFVQQLRHQARWYAQILQHSYSLSPGTGQMMLLAYLNEVTHDWSGQRLREQSPNSAILPSKRPSAVKARLSLGMPIRDSSRVLFSSDGAKFRLVVRASGRYEDSLLIPPATWHRVVV